MIESNLTFLACFGLNDPIRKEVPKVIYDLVRSSTNTRIISGDHIECAKFAAYKIRLMVEGENDECCMSGDQFYEICS